MGLHLTRFIWRATSGLRARTRAPKQPPGVRRCPRPTTLASDGRGESRWPCSKPRHAGRKRVDFQLRQFNWRGVRPRTAADTPASAQEDVQPGGGRRGAGLGRTHGFATPRAHRAKGCDATWDARLQLFAGTRLSHPPLAVPTRTLIPVKKAANERVVGKAALPGARSHLLYEPAGSSWRHGLSAGA